MDHLEIEFKLLLNQKTYSKLVEKYKNKIQADYTQTNFYLFHPILDEKRYSLRIREKNNNYELTLKTPASIGLNEYNIDIDKDIKDQIFNHQHVSNRIFDLLEKENVFIKDLECGHYLTTHRKDIPLKYGLLSLDDNKYNGHQDYELEFEVTDYEKGKEEFEELLAECHLEYTGNCLSKIRRMKQTIK